MVGVFRTWRMGDRLLAAINRLEVREGKVGEMVGGGGEWLVVDVVRTGMGTRLKLDVRPL